jgi:hypothetical protein
MRCSWAFAIPEAEARSVICARPALAVRFSFARGWVWLCAFFLPAAERGAEPQLSIDRWAGFADPAHRTSICAA